MLKPGQIAVVGAAESTKIGAVPELSQIGLHADAALNAMADAGLKPTDIDGLASTTDGVVAVVEVSVDNGATWRRAIGRENWTFLWQTGPPKSVTLMPMVGSMVLVGVKSMPTSTPWPTPPVT